MKVWILRVIDEDYDIDWRIEGVYKTRMRAEEVGQHTPCYRYDIEEWEVSD